MPRQRDAPCGLWNSQLLKPDAWKAYHRRRSGDERDAKPRSDERDNREEFVGLLYDPRRKAGCRADAQDVIVETCRS